MAQAVLQREWGRPLVELAARAERLPAILKADLRCGDWIVVTTRNSIYWLCVLPDRSFTVAGGWFDRNGVSPQRVGINGCTFGGSAIKTDIVAAPGLFLEFDNSVTTTRIREARLVRGEEPTRYQ